MEGNRLKYIFVTIALCCTLPCIGQNNSALIDSANKAYSEAHYDQAILFYEQVLDEGYEAAELYYNMGNAYYKLGNIPGAILNYERAAKLDPYDEDITFNLQLVNLKTVDKIETIPTFFISDWSTDLANVNSDDKWSGIAAAALWLGILLFCLYLAVNSSALKKLLFWLSIILVLTNFVTMGLAYKKHNKMYNNREAIVFSPSVIVKSSPGSSGTDLVLLHEGTKVMILDEVAEWSKIKLADGSIGWLPVVSIEVI